MCEPDDMIGDMDVGVEPTTTEEEEQGVSPANAGGEGSPRGEGSPYFSSPRGFNVLSQELFNAEAFIRPTLNVGFIPPIYLLDKELYAQVKPPPVVMTLEDRLAQLSEEERAALAEVRQHRDAAGWDPKEVDDWMMMRYLVARDWKTKKAIPMIEKTLQWRSEKQARTMICSRCVANPNAHMSCFVGWDLQHRPVSYMSHRWALERHNMEENVEHMLENYNHMERLMPVGVWKWVACVDFVTYSHWKDGSPKSGKEVINMLQDHFPERLAMQVLVDPPTTFWVLWKILCVFIDPKTKQKAQFWYTDQSPKIQDEFPKIFPTHLSDYLVNAFLENKKKPLKQKK